MASCLRICNLLPNPELSIRLQQNGVYRHDVAMRVCAVAALLMAVIGVVMIGVAAGQYAHPAIGLGLVMGAFLFCAISSCIGCGLEKRLPDEITLKDVYHPHSAPGSDASSDEAEEV